LVNIDKRERNNLLTNPGPKLGGLGLAICGGNFPSYKEIIVYVIRTGLKVVKRGNTTKTCGHTKKCCEKPAVSGACDPGICCTLPQRKAWRV